MTQEQFAECAQAHRAITFGLGIVKANGGAYCEIAIADVERYLRLLAACTAAVKEETEECGFFQRALTGQGRREIQP